MSFKNMSEKKSSTRPDLTITNQTTMASHSQDGAEFDQNALKFFEVIGDIYEFQSNKSDESSEKLSQLPPAERRVATKPNPTFKDKPKGPLRCLTIKKKNNRKNAKNRPSRDQSLTSTNFASILY